MLPWGWRTDDILNKIEPRSATHQPDAVLIHPASNDIFQWLSIQSTVDELTEIVFLLRRANWEVIRNATETTSPSDLPYRPSSVLRQQLHSRAMRLLSRLEYERSFVARWVTYFVRIPYTQCVIYGFAISGV